MVGEYNDRGASAAMGFFFNQLANHRVIAPGCLQMKYKSIKTNDC